MAQFFYISQHIGIALIFFELVYVYVQKPTRLQQNLLAILVTTLIDHVGYFLVIRATDYNSALVALKITYLGKAFIPLATFGFMIETYRLKMQKWLLATLFTIHCAIISLVITCEYQNIYYTSIEFSTDGLLPHFNLGHGIVYNIYYYGLVSFYLLAMLIVSIVQYGKARLKIEKKRIICISSIAIVSMLGMLLLVTGWFPGYDTTEICYVISSAILMLCIVKYNLLDPLSAAKDTVLDETDDGILVTDEKDTIIYMNPKAKQLYNSFGIEDYESLKQYFRKLSSNNDVYEIDKTYYRYSENDIVEKGDIYGRIYTLHDVTKEHVAMQKLEQQREIAESANAAKSNFLARISHEIRTPLNAVLGMDEMIIRESKEISVKEYAMTIKTSAKFLLSIINDILDFSKIESGKMEIIPTEYELDSFINDIYHILDEKAKRKDLELIVEVDGTLPNKLLGDDVRIRQVLLNLLNNSIKYTHEGWVKLSVTGRRAGKTQILHYEISDTGIGIKKEDLPKLFNTFERIEEKKNKNIEGTGLGMSIVKNLLSLMNTEVCVESVYGEGTTFSFDLEQEIINDEPIGNIEERLKKKTMNYTYQASFHAPDAKILIVDDNDINRFVFECLLKEVEVQVSKAESGKEALELTKNEHFDLIFMDHMMPEMDGIETFHNIKEQKDGLNNETPVVILTANAVEGAKEYYAKEGFDGFMTKPFESETLEAKIKELLPADLVKK